MSCGALYMQYGDAAGGATSSAVVIDLHAHMCACACLYRRRGAVQRRVLPVRVRTQRAAQRVVCGARRHHDCLCRRHGQRQVDHHATHLPLLRRQRRRHHHRRPGHPRRHAALAAAHRGHGAAGKGLGRCGGTDCRGSMCLHKSLPASSCCFSWSAPNQCACVRG